MFLGHTLLKVAALTDFLKDVLPPRPQYPPGIFDRPLKRTYDYIVIGSGGAGGIIATRLSEDPVSVLLLEAGGSDLENEFTQIPGLRNKLKGTHQVWGYKTVEQKNSHFARKDGISMYPQGKVLGGSGSINSMNFIRGNRHDYDEWEKEGCTGWGYDGVLNYFNKLENVDIPEFKNSTYRGSTGPITITHTATTSLEYFYQKGAEELGYPTTDCNGYNQTGFCQTQGNIKNGERCSTASCYLTPVIDRRNLQISLDSHVRKIIVKRNVARGVKFIKHGKQKKVFARNEIILSAGAIGSPHILLLSGIGPKDHIRMMKIPLKADLPVGQNLQTHIMLILHYSTNIMLNVRYEEEEEEKVSLEYILRKQGPHTQLADGHFFTRVHQETPLKLYPDMQLQFVPKSMGGISALLKEEVRKELLNRTKSSGFEVILFLLHPKDRGEIKLASRNPLQSPIIDPKCLSDDTDIDKMIKMIRFIQNFEQTKSWRSIDAQMIRLDTTNHCSDLPYDIDDYWRCIILNYIRSAGHQTGTCRMGSFTDPTAVVDPRLRVKGIHKLRVADASIMRNVPSGNTYAAAMMIGEKAADMIKQDRMSKNDKS